MGQEYSDGFMNTFSFPIIHVCVFLAMRVLFGEHTNHLLRVVP